MRQSGLEPWLAVDADDHIALFDPEDFGPIPAHARNPDRDDEKWRQIIALPVLGDYSVIADAEINVGPSIEAARRGIFTFDYGLGNSVGPFKRIAFPFRPLRVKELPRDNLRRSALLVRLPSIHFAVSTSIGVSELAVQLEPPNLDWVERQLTATTALMVKAVKEGNIERARHLRLGYAQISDVLIEVMRLSQRKRA